MYDKATYYGIDSTWFLFNQKKKDVKSYSISWYILSHTPLFEVLGLDLW